MAEEKEAATESAVSAAASTGGNSKLPTMLSIVNLVFTLGVVVVLVLAHLKEKAKPTVDDIVAGQAKTKAHGESAEGHGAKEGHAPASVGGVEEIDAGKIISLDTFTVNLSNGVGTNPRYIRINVSVELEQGVPDQEFTVKVPRVRDTIINLLNAKKASEVNAPEGREQLKEEIKKSINSFLTQSKVKGIYFTNFAITQ